MKTSNKYYKIKWSSFFATILILGIAILGAFAIRSKEYTPKSPILQETKPQHPQNSTGQYSNADFGLLIQENLSDLGFIDSLTFNGKSEGRFSITGTLSNPARLAAICPDLQAMEGVLNSLKGKQITINGHLGENEAGCGQFVSDTISFSGLTLPAGIATEYIEQYTSLNSLLEVPIHQIEMNEDGVHFIDEIPTAIQIASYNQQISSLSEEG